MDDRKQRERQMIRTFFIVLLAAFSMNAQVKITRGTDRISVEIAGTPYTDFFFPIDGNKPYVYPLRTASGIVVTRHYPMEQFAGETNDHPHHRGMFFGHGDINGINFWATEPNIPAANKGSMVLKKVLEAKGGAKSGTIKTVFDGLDPDGKPMMTETRTLTFYSGPELRVIDFDIRIEALRQLKFADTKEGTFGIRLATALSEDRNGKMVNAEGGQGEKNVWGKRSPWVDYFGPVDGKTVGVAIMDHPSNPRYPTYWHARAYGLFAANIFGVRDFTGDKTKDGSLTVDAGKSVTFRYRIVIHPGDFQSAGIASLYRQYISEK
jgi:Methane oxygenase PmoA